MNKEDFFKQLYKDKSRLNGDSVYDYVKNVQKNLLDIGIENTDLLTSALLIPDYTTYKTLSEGRIRLMFTPEVVNILTNYKAISNDEVSKVSAKDFNEDKILQYYVSLIDHPNVLLLRLAERVENIRTSTVLDPEKQQHIAERALYLYSPLCKLLGIYEFKNILEEEAFKILEPESYFNITRILKERDKKLRRELDNIIEFLTEVFEEHGFKHFLITSRIKQPYSIFKKILKYKARGAKIEEDLSNVHDIVAIRIILDTVDQCYEAEGMLRELWDEVPGDRDDYILIPKASGYKSIHNNFYVKHDLVLEVQLRTHEMHEYNEFGEASHVVYKMGPKFKKVFNENPQLLKEINYSLNKSALKIDHFSQNVYVLTPKRHIIELPKGSGVLDFAYKIHEHLGHTCVSALVNGKQVDFGYKLQTGDNVEIKTARNQKPKRDWLQYVSTERARRLINRFVSNEIDSYKSNNI